MRAVEGWWPFSDGDPPRSVAGSLGACHPPRGPRNRALSAYLRFWFLWFPLLKLVSQRHAKCGAIWSRQLWKAGRRLDAAQRERFFQAGLKAALRLDRLEFRAWLLRRVRNPPLAAPVDLACYAISDADIALLMKAARADTSGRS